MPVNKTLAGFAAAVALQLAVLAAVPAQKAWTLASGRTVLLKTAPVDPYSIMSGYYVTLSYDISRPSAVPGWSDLKDQTAVYVVLREGPDGCWAAESVHLAPPEVPPDRVVIKGEKEYDRIKYGIETYYVPEKARETVEKDLREHGREARVEVKVDSFGHAAVTRMLIGERVYDF